MAPKWKHRRRDVRDDQRVPWSPNSVLEKKLHHSQREKARHRGVMAKLSSLIRMVPTPDESAISKVAQFRVTTNFLRSLECSIQAECNKRLLPVPPRCSLFTDGDSQRKGLDLDRTSREKLNEEMNAAIETLDEDDTAIVPDWDLPPTDPQVVTDLREIYGTSQEDWAAAGPSQDASQSRDDVFDTSYVDVICGLDKSMPLHDAPEVFVVSKNGTVTPVGVQEKPS